jgi:hypothetical protein
MPPFRRFLLLALPVFLALVVTTPGALAIDAPAGKVVLTVTGNVGLPNGPGKADFDMAMLEKLTQHTFTASTPWYPEPKTFTGPLLRDVLAAAGAKGALLRAGALNDYKTDIPAADADRYDVIVARLLDGKPMLTREKGPLFIVYPFDSSADLHSAQYYARSAWQLRTLEVR